MEDSPTSQRPWRRRLAAAATSAALALFFAGLAVRLTVRDRILVANTIYYATPWSILCVLGGFACWQLRRRGASRARRAVLAVAAVACGVAWSITSWSDRAQRPEDHDVCILNWNLGHGNLGLKELAAGAAALHPDIAVFIEADPEDMDVRAVFHSAFPDHRVFILGGGIVLVSRWPGGEARAYEIGDERAETRVREVDLATPWGEWTVFCCDIASDIVLQREPHLRELAARIAQRKNPVIVAGDFNTPLDSVHLQMLREMGFSEAFETAGAGYLPTWPVPCPVLSLDQVWLGGGLQPVACRRHWSWRSDHAAVIAVIRPKGS